MTTPFDRCRCDDVDHLEDDDAIAYSQGHLRLQHVAGDAWSSDWRCPVTGACWMERYQFGWRPGSRYVVLDRVTPRPASATDPDAGRIATAEQARAATPAPQALTAAIAPAARAVTNGSRRLVLVGTAVALASVAASGLLA